MKIKIKEIADLVEGEIFGNHDIIISGVAKIEEASESDITFLYHPSYEKFLSTTKASAILIKTGFNKSNKNLTYIEVNAPDLALQKILLKFFNPKFELNGIDKTSSIDPTAIIEENVAIGKNVVIGKNVKVGKNTKIFHNCVIAENVEIGENSFFHSNVTVRENCKIGKRNIIHSGTVIGSDGFGYNNVQGKYLKIPQIGNVILEDDVELGANVTIDRAALGSTIIKQGTKIDNLVQIAHNVSVGENTVISAQTGISGSTRVGDRCILAGQVGVAGHLNIADGSIIAAQSGISKSITKPGMYFGYPAKEAGLARRLEAHIRNLPDYAKRIKELEKQINELKNIKEKEC